MARIMICDDSSFMRMMLKRIITDSGHEVVAEASNGKEATVMYHKHKPDLVTMDITMPEVDGIAAVKLIREKDPLALIIMVSAVGQKTIVTDAIRAGASDFIVKPFEPEDVTKTIRKNLESRM